MKLRIIGTGAAGNKAAISTVECGLLAIEDVLLLNSTLRDIPNEYRKGAYCFEQSEGGCGKEKRKGALLAINSLKNGNLANVIDEFINDDIELVILTASTEGGTGAGSISVISKYCYELGIPVMLFLFTGFEDDARGLRNTIEVFQELDERYTIQTISNKKFLNISNNRISCEKLANDEFIKRVSTISGKGIVDSERNMDEFDLFKSATTPGFMTVCTKEIEKIKSIDQFNKIVIDILDSDYSLDIQNKSCARLGIIININIDSQNYIDYNFKEIKDRVGVPYEVFTHIQSDSTQPEFISIIASGMNLPLDEIKNINTRYMELNSKTSKDSDSFFDQIASLRGDTSDSKFDISSKRRNRKGNTMEFIEKLESSMSDKIKDINQKSNY